MHGQTWLDVFSSMLSEYHVSCFPELKNAPHGPGGANAYTKKKNVMQYLGNLCLMLQMDFFEKGMNLNFPPKMFSPLFQKPYIPQ